MIKSKYENLEEALELIGSDKSEAFIEGLDESLGRAIEKVQGSDNAHVESAPRLTSEEKEKLERVLESVLKRKLNFSYSRNPRLLGGFKVTIGDWKLDSSLAHQLELMKQNLEGNL